jgi:hypothetical protein
MVTNHKAFAGGGGPCSKCKMYLFAPFSGRPSASTKAERIHHVLGGHWRRAAAGKVGGAVELVASADREIEIALRQRAKLLPPRGLRLGDAEIGKGR